MNADKRISTAKGKGLGAANAVKGKGLDGAKAVKGKGLGAASGKQISWKRTALVERAKDGKRPWRWWLWPLLALPALLAMGLWSISHISGDTEELTREILADRGVPTDGLDIDASFRDVDIDGELPAGVTATQVEQWLEETDDLHGDIADADVDGLVAAAPAEQAPIDVDVISDGESITLQGRVPSEAHRVELVEAAEATGLEVNHEQLIAVLAEPSAADADGQIRNLAGVIGGLGVGSFIAADLALDDDGPTTGTIRAATIDSADQLTGTAGDGVTVTAPEPEPELGAIDTQVDYDGDTIVLNGTVLTDAQAASLEEAAVGVVGADNVVNNLVVSGLDEAVEDADGRVGSLASAIGTFDGLNRADGSLTDTDLTVNGEAGAEAGKTAADGAIASAADTGLRPGGEITVAEVEISLEEEIDLLQAELDALQDEIRRNVVFASDSSELSPAAQGTLDQVIEAMVRYPRPVVEVGGHTDSQGNDGYNADLSQRRAQSVVDYVAAGTSADRLNPVGFGETQPVADNSLEEGRLQNRRVEFIAKESF